MLHTLLHADEMTQQHVVNYLDAKRSTCTCIYKCKSIQTKVRQFHTAVRVTQ